ncbi:MAG: outer membrane receptor for ferrienterochelin and colicins [Bacteroidia bacterium]
MFNAWKSFLDQHCINAILVVVMLVGARNSAYSQSSATFTVLSQSDNLPIQYAYVEIRVESDVTFDLLSESYTNAQGQVKLEIVNRMFWIKVSSLGYADYQDSMIMATGKEVNIFLKEKEHVLDDAVVTVQYDKRTAQKAVERITVIDQRDFDARSVFNVRDALIQQLNVQIRNDNSTGSALSLMGISGQNVKVLIDGVPVIGRLDGNIDLSQINLNDVQRIEIIEGPVSTNYGSNALAGVINIITKKSSSPKGELNFDSYAETVGQTNFSLAGGKNFKKWNIRANVGRNFFDGYTPGGSGRWDLWKPKEQVFGRIQLARTFGKWDILVKSEAFNERLLNAGKPLSPYYQTAFDEWFITHRRDQKVDATFRIAEGRVLNGFVAFNTYSRERNKYFRDLVSLGSETVSSDGGSDTTGFDAILSRSTYSVFPKNKRLNYQFGYDFIYEVGRGVRIEDGKQDLMDLAVFTTAEYKVSSQLTLKPGIRFAKNSGYDAPPVPMISAKLHRGKYTYRASYSRGFRAPEIKELYIEFVDINHFVLGNQNLRAEQSHNYLFSIDGSRLYKKVLIKPSLSGFYNNIQNKITLASYAPNKYTYVNISAFETTGGNFRINLVSNKVRAGIGVAVTGLRSNLVTASESFNFYSEFNSNIQYALGKTSLSVFIKYNGKQNFYTIDAENAAVVERLTGAYSLADAQVSRSFFKERLKVNLGSKNVFNVTNIDNVLSQSGAHGSDANYMAVGMGRSYFVKMSYRVK